MGKAGNNTKRNRSIQLGQTEQLDIIDPDKKKPKDDWVVGKGDYQDYQYWKVPEQYSIESLLKEQEG